MDFKIQNLYANIFDVNVLGNCRHLRKILKKNICIECIKSTFINNTDIILSPVINNSYDFSMFPFYRIEFEDIVQYFLQTLPFREACDFILEYMIQAVKREKNAIRFNSSYSNYIFKLHNTFPATPSANVYHSGMHNYYASPMYIDLIKRPTNRSTNYGNEYFLN